MSRWINLDGTVNTRDLGGLPLAAGGLTRSRRLIRSDDLRALSPSDVGYLIDKLGVRTVVDIRTRVEVQSEDPGPLSNEPAITIHHMPLMEADWRKIGSEHHDGPTAASSTQSASTRRSVVDTYLDFLEYRADSILQVLKTIAQSREPMIVHCAAGKDRTGIVIALVLSEVEVERDAVIADYAISAERINAIMARLTSNPSYAGVRDRLDVDSNRPLEATMKSFLSRVDEHFGGVPNWLRSHGWLERDAANLRQKLAK